jgi:hypothetical protein
VPTRGTCTMPPTAYGPGAAAGDLEDRGSVWRRAWSTP